MMLQRLLFWCLLPFVIPQALYVRRTAPRFAGASGPDNGCIGEGEGLSLLAIGDSIIAGVGASTFDTALVGRTAEAISNLTGQTVCWRAIGQTGARSKKVAQRLTKRIKADDYRVIVVSVGVNDVTSLQRTHRWKENIIQLLDTLHTQCPDAVIAVSGIPPLWGFPLLPAPLKYVLGLRAKTFDKALQDIVQQRSYGLYVPLRFQPEKSQFSEDGYHPSEDSYAKLGEAFGEAIVEHPLLSRAAQI